MCLPVSGLVYLTYSSPWLDVCRDVLSPPLSLTQTSAEFTAPRRLLISFQSFAEIGEHTKICFHCRLPPSWGVYHTVGNPACFLHLGSSTPIRLCIGKYFQMESHLETQESRSFSAQKGLLPVLPLFIFMQLVISYLFEKDFQGWCLGLCRVPCTSRSCCLLFREEPAISKHWKFG